MEQIVLPGQKGDCEENYFTPSFKMAKVQEDGIASNRDLSNSDLHVVVSV